MTSKIQITDEMVERAHAELSTVSIEPGVAHGGVTLGHSKECVRKALEAALNPPPEEPDIPVSEGMLEAGYEASARGWNTMHLRNAAIYRAMKKARRKEEGQPTFPRGPFYSHSRKGEENCTRTGHRRKDDPK